MLSFAKVVPVSKFKLNEWNGRKDSQIMHFWTKVFQFRKCLEEKSCNESFSRWDENRPDCIACAVDNSWRADLVFKIKELHDIMALRVLTHGADTLWQLCGRRWGQDCYLWKHEMVLKMSLTCPCNSLSLCGILITMISAKFVQCI